MPPDADVAANLAAVRRRLDAAARRAHRLPSDITLVAVSKIVAPDAVRAAVAAGHRVFGENRVQEAERKQAALTGLDVEWHLIGHLQSNKVRKAVGLFPWIESVDNLDLLRRVEGAAQDLGRRPAVLLQVDLAHEHTKHGADSGTLTALAEAAAASSTVDLRGLMLVPPRPATPEDSRPWFRQLRELRDDLVAGGIPAGKLQELSMGMSHDYEVAIEEGATIVRVGTAIFGARPPAAQP